MSRSRSSILRKVLQECGLLALYVLVPALAGTVLLDYWFHNWGRPSQPDLGATTLGVPPGVMMYMHPVELKDGSPAPGLDVESLDGSAAFHLDQYRGVKPVVLIFGSMTCTLFQPYIPELESVYQEYKDRAEFAFISIHEAGHQMEGFEYLLQGQEDNENHTRCVRKAMRQGKLSLPGFIDSSDNAALRDYGAFPARLVIVDVNGRIAHDFGRVLGSPWYLPSVRKVLTDVVRPVGLASRQPLEMAQQEGYLASTAEQMHNNQENSGAFSR